MGRPDSSSSWTKAVKVWWSAVAMRYSCVPSGRRCSVWLSSSTLSFRGTAGHRKLPESCKEYNIFNYTEYRDNNYGLQDSLKQWLSLTNDLSHSVMAGAVRAWWWAARVETAKWWWRRWPARSTSWDPNMALSLTIGMICNTKVNFSRLYRIYRMKESRGY